MKKYNEIAVIFKTEELNDSVDEYKPIAIVNGYYDNFTDCFVDSNGNYYPHIINHVSEMGFAFRADISRLKSKYPILPVGISKKIIYNAIRKLKYYYIDEEQSLEQVPGILFGDSHMGLSMLMDEDIKLYYKRFYDFFYKKLEVEENTELEESEQLEVEESEQKEEMSFDLANIYKTVTETVIAQDEPIKKILTAVWKHYNNFSDNKSRNILINGSTGVGKTETFRVLSKLVSVPCVITSATEYTAAGYQGKSVEDMLLSLIVKANGDVRKAERGILIIDEIDKIAESNSRSSQVNQRDVQEALLKILEDGVVTLRYGQEIVNFDTSKLLIIGMGSWSRIDLTPPKVVGFEAKVPKKTYKDITKEEIVKNGIIPELMGRFSSIVQMNELDYESFIRILNSKNSIIELNKKFFSKKGVELVIDESAIVAIARKASISNYGARGLDETIEKALSVASFEIGCNPEMYSRLLVNDKTIEDPKKYVLVKKED